MGREIQKYSLVEELRKKDDELMCSPSVMGMTCLTYLNYINAMRSTMFTSHLKQFLNLKHPQFAYVFTNNENLIGKYSSGYKQVKNNMTVYKKIVKFDDILDEPNIYVLFLHNEDDDSYDVVERKVCHDLTENFGYDYNNDVIDSLKEGDKIDEDTVLIRSTSYDEDMNYSYGRNVTVMYTLEPYTSEDAAVASRSLTEKLSSIETETWRIGINSNDFLINLYGDKNNYQPLPEIGQVVSDKLAVIRRQFNNQLLFDFKDDSLNEIHESDSIYYIDKDVTVIDYTIYNNNDERMDNPFYAQINKYYDSQIKYYTEIVETIEAIKDSGCSYSKKIDYLYKRALDVIDTEKKWRDGDNAFGNMEIEVTIHRDVPLAKGSKITGRYGNKSVISEIREDEDMPYTKDGRRVDLMLNLLAIINRTTSYPLYEIFMTGAAYQVRQKMKTLSTYKEKENMYFDFLRILNEKQADKFYKSYSKKSKKEKEVLINDVIEDGIYIHQLPMWESLPIFYRCKNLLNKFDFIKKDDVYIRKWNREYKILRKYFIGDMYIMKLKQSDRRGFSARSTGALDTKSLPTRSFKSRSHLERISSSCIRFGEFESLNFSIGILPEDIALFHALYRTSIKGRKDIINVMFSDEDEDAIQKIDSSYTSRVSEWFNVILKSLGIELDFIDDEESIKVLNDDEITPHELNGSVYLCTDYQFYLLERIELIKEEVLSQNPIMTSSMLEKTIEEILKSNSFINGPLKDELGDIKYDISNEVSYEEPKTEEVKVDHDKEQNINED